MGCPSCGNRDPAKAKPWVRDGGGRGRRRIMECIGSECLVCGAAWEHSLAEAFSLFDAPTPEMTPGDLGLSDMRRLDAAISAREAPHG